MVDARALRIAQSIRFKTYYAASLNQICQQLLDRYLLYSTYLDPPSQDDGSLPRLLLHQTGLIHCWNIQGSVSAG